MLKLSHLLTGITSFFAKRAMSLKKSRFIATRIMSNTAASNAVISRRNPTENVDLRVWVLHALRYTEAVEGNQELIQSGRTLGHSLVVGHLHAIAKIVFNFLRRVEGIIRDCLHVLVEAAVYPSLLHLVGSISGDVLDGVSSHSVPCWEWSGWIFFFGFVT